MPASRSRTICLWSIALEHVCVAGIIALTGSDKAFLATGFGGLGAVAAVTILIAVSRRRPFWFKAHVTLALVFLLTLVYHALLLLDRISLPSPLEKTFRPLLLGSGKYDFLLVVLYVFTAVVVMTALISAFVSNATKKKRKDQSDIARQSVAMEVPAGKGVRSPILAPKTAAFPRQDSTSGASDSFALGDRRRSFVDSSSPLIFPFDPSQVQPPRFQAQPFTLPPRSGSIESNITATTAPRFPPQSFALPPRSGSKDSKMATTIGNGHSEPWPQNSSQHQTAVNAVGTGYVNSVVRHAYTETAPQNFNQKAAIEPGYVSQHAYTETPAQNISQQQADMNAVQAGYVTPVVQQAYVEEQTQSSNQQTDVNAVKTGYVAPAVQQTYTVAQAQNPNQPDMDASAVETGYVVPVVQQAYKDSAQNSNAAKTGVNAVTTRYVNPVVQQAFTESPAQNSNEPAGVKAVETGYVAPVVQQAYTEAPTQNSNEPQTGVKAVETRYVARVVQQAYTGGDAQNSSRQQTGMNAVEPGFVSPIMKQAHMEAQAQNSSQQQTGVNAVATGYVAPVVQQAFTVEVPTAEVQYRVRLDVNPATNDHGERVVQQAQTTTTNVLLPQTSPKRSSDKKTSDPKQLLTISARDSDVSSFLLAKEQAATPSVPRLPAAGRASGPDVKASELSQYERPTSLGNVALQPSSAAESNFPFSPQAQVTSRTIANQQMFQYGSDGWNSLDGLQLPPDVDTIFENEDDDQNSDDGASTILPMDSISQVGARNDDEQYDRGAYAGRPGMLIYPPPSQAYPGQVLYYDAPPQGMSYGKPWAAQAGYWPQQSGNWGYQPPHQPMTYPWPQPPMSSPPSSDGSRVSPTIARRQQHT